LDALRVKYGGQRCIKGLVEVPQRCPKSPIFSLLSPYPRSLAQYCQDGGFIVRPVVPPTVPVGAQRIRVCIHSGNATEEIERLVDRIEKWILVKMREGIVQELNIEKPHL
jgi:8-amino-7-oxononanoate synthase